MSGNRFENLLLTPSYAWTSNMVNLLPKTSFINTELGFKLTLSLGDLVFFSSPSCRAKLETAQVT